MMTEAAMYIVTMMKQAIRATLKETNLNTLMMATMSMIAIISVQIQFLSTAHQPPTSKHPNTNPKTSITLTLSLNTILSFVSQPVLMKQKPSMPTTVPAAIMEIVSTTPMSIYVTLGLKMLSNPTTSIETVTMAIIGYPYCMPQPLNEFHLPMQVARMSITVAARIKTNPPYQKKVELQEMSQFRVYWKVPIGAMESSIVSKQLLFQSTEGQLSKREIVHYAVLQKSELREGQNRFFNVFTLRLRAKVLPTMISSSALLLEYCDCVWEYPQRSGLHWRGLGLGIKFGLIPPVGEQMSSEWEGKARVTERDVTIEMKYAVNKNVFNDII